MAKHISLLHYIARRFALVTLFPVIVITAMVWFALSPVIRSNIISQNQSLARTVSGQISAHLDGGERQLIALSKIITDNGGLESDTIIAMLDHACGDGELFETVYITSDHGERIRYVGLASSRRFQRDDFLGLDISSRNFYSSDLQTGQLIWSDPFLSTVSGWQAVAVAVPLSHSVLVGEITLERLSAFISNLPLEAQFRTFVWDRKQRILADSKMLLAGQHLTGTLIFSSADKSKDKVLHSFSVAGQKFVGSTTGITKLGWTVQVAQPSQYAFQPIVTTFIIIIMGLIISLVFITFVSIQQGIIFSEQIANYIEYARSIASGEYNIKWPSFRILEYQELANSLQSMGVTIHEREQKLMESENYMRITLDSIGDAVITTDTQGGVTQLNPAAAMLTGWEATEATGRKLTDVYQVFDLDSRLPVADPVEKVLAPDSTVERPGNGILISREGNEYLVTENIFPILDAEDNSIGSVLVFRDVTEAYTQELIIRDNESRLRQLTENIPGAVIQIRTTVDHVFQNEFLSAKTSQIFGLDVKGDNLLDQFFQCIPDEDKECYTLSMQQAVEKVVPWHYEGRFKKPDGQEIWFSADANPRTDGDSVIYYGVLRDITSRKLIEQQLQDSEERFRLLAESSLTGIYLIQNGRFTYVNNAMATMFGYEVNEVVDNMHVEKLIYQEDISLVHKNIRQRVSEEKESARYLFRGLRKDGQIFHVEVHGRAIVYQGARGIIGTLVDVTDRIHFEQALQKSEKRFRSLFNGAPMMYVITDDSPDRKIVDVNDTFLKRLGYSKESVLNTPLTIYYTDDSVGLMAKRQEMEQTPEVGKVPVERQLLTIDGQLVSALVDSVPEYDEEGNITGMRIMLLDDTERRKAEEEVNKLRTFLTNVYNSMPSVLIGVDTHLRVTQWNKQAEHYTGVVFSDAALELLSDVYPKMAEHNNDIRKAIATGQTILTSKIPTTRDGVTRFEDISIYPILGGKEGAVVRIEDVTQRVHMEEMMIQSEKMLSIGGLAAGMAHEINNPLAGLMHNSQILENRLFGDLPANIKAAQAVGLDITVLHDYMQKRKLPKLLGHMQDSGARIAAIVNNMLSFSRKSENVRSTHELCSLLDQSVELAQTDYDMKKGYDFKSVEVVREYKQKISVACEESKLQQVFLNILKNGAEAMADSPGDAPPKFTLRVIEEGGWAKIEIEDNGPGMDKITRKRIFEPFFTTKEVGKGTGLGLSVSYYIITEDHGGKMQVQSTSGHGSTFIIHLPKA
ncbi:PAS domain S-box protein [Desulfogranum marinum]|uniref:PAS domain S-box protein n=1 Tax=Desulfogranum marinum TaxID=453220 RepID=UPI001965B1D6|nr:PAS domain S-box protein [Desulfogranum marinum]MBM9511120.1 PAS domain S-box protein [Desulfogranum marinum]